MMPEQIWPDIKPLPIKTLNELIKEVSTKHNVLLWQIKSSRRHSKLTAARKEFCVKASEQGITHEEIAQMLNRSRSNITYLIHSWYEEEEKKEAAKNRRYLNE